MRKSEKIPQPKFRVPQCAYCRKYFVNGDKVSYFSDPDDPEAPTIGLHHHCIHKYSDIER